MCLVKWAWFYPNKLRNLFTSVDWRVLFKQRCQTQNGAVQVTQSKLLQNQSAFFYYYYDVRKIRNTFNVVSSLNQKYSSLFTIQHNISDISLKMAPWRGNKRLRRLVSPRGGNPWLLLQPTYWSNPDTLEFTRKHFRSKQFLEREFSWRTKFCPFFKFCYKTYIRKNKK